MRKINVLLLDAEDAFIKQYQKEHNIRCIDEAVNNIILAVKRHQEKSE